jgi:arsenite methyltransferase
VSTSTKTAPAFDASMVERLNKLYASPQAVAQRSRFRQLLAARPGELGLDIGCGVGHLTCELARDVSPGGRIIAVDSSNEMVRGSKARIDDNRLGHCVEVIRGDAIALDLPNESFDFVVAVQVYSYVHQVARAIAEAARVLRNGGRLAVLETDWDMCTYESTDHALTRRILDGSWRFAHSHLPRQLHRLLRESGLVLTQCDAFPIIETEYNADSFGAGLITIARDAAVRHGIAAADADAWATDIRSRSTDGEYFFCTNRFIFVAAK